MEVMKNFKKKRQEAIDEFKWQYYFYYYIIYIIAFGCSSLDYTTSAQK